MLRRLIAWLMPSPVPCPRCGAALKSDLEGSLRINPERGPDGMPLDGAPLWSEGFRCTACGARLALVHRSRAASTWDDISTQPWRTIGPAP